MKTITNSGIIEKHSNNGHTQTILIEEKDVLFKIVIHVESYDFQSYAKLYIMNSKREWTTLHSLIPKKYSLTNFYSPYSEDKYKYIINELKKIIKKLAPTIVLSTDIVESI